MLYAMDGLPIPEGDVYELTGYSNSPVFRDFVKKMLLAMINSDSRERTRKALQAAAIWDKTLILPDEIPSTKGEHLFPVMDAFEQKHYPISKYF